MSKQPMLWKEVPDGAVVELAEDLYQLTTKDISQYAYYTKAEIDERLTVVHPKGSRFMFNKADMSLDSDTGMIGIDGQDIVLPMYNIIA